MNTAKEAEINFDWGRAERIGLSETVLSDGKSPGQLKAIAEAVRARGARCLFTRLSPEYAVALGDIDYHEISRTGIVGTLERPTGVPRVCIVTAGTSDAPAAWEAARTLAFHGHGASTIFDVGVAGLHRLLSRLDDIARHEVVIVVAGMDAALASVVAGQVGVPVIGVPTSIGYGTARSGETALNAMLTSCAAGLAVVNIDNGFGAACAAIRCLARARD